MTKRKEAKTRIGPPSTGNLALEPAPEPECVTLLSFAVGVPFAAAGHRSDCRYGKCYKNPGYASHDAQNGWFNFRFFGDFSGPRGPLLRKAIEIDTPDPRYWNAYDDCIGA